MSNTERTLFVDAELPLTGTTDRWGILVEDHHISAVVPMADVPSTLGVHVIDVAGAAVLPGMTDAHVHAVESGVELMRCDLSDTVSRDDALATIARYVTDNPDADWIVGRGWSLSHFRYTDTMLESLDRITGARPAYLSNRDGHSAWVNSAALRLAGITADIADPPGGRIERLPDGSPAGLLHESAMQLVSGLLPQLDDQARMAGLLAAQSRLLSLGVTGWQEAIVGDFVPTTDVLSVYRRAADTGELLTRVTGNLWVPRTEFSDCVETFVGLRAEVPATSRFQLTGAKIMYDGVCETFTAAVSVPYRTGTEYPTGLTFFDKSELQPIVIALDRAGFDLHFHAIGDRAVADTVEMLEATDGTGRRHQIAHLQLTNPGLIQRMAAKGIIANIQPFWAQNDDQMTDMALPYLPAELFAHQYEFATMAHCGVQLANGSDWPVSSPNPFDQIHVAVNRSYPGSGDTFFPAERLTRRDALVAGTAGSAYASRQESVRGSLSPGLEADLVVLEGPLSNVADDDLHTVRVAQTYVNGQLAFER
ncbi:amidohydrolase [Mycolicibacterium brisbanense]